MPRERLLFFRPGLRYDPRGRRRYRVQSASVPLLSSVSGRHVPPSGSEYDMRQSAATRRRACIVRYISNASPPITPRNQNFYDPSSSNLTHFETLLCDGAFQILVTPQEAGGWQLKDEVARFAFGTDALGWRCLYGTIGFCGGGGQCRPEAPRAPHPAPHAPLTTRRAFRQAAYRALALHVALRRNFGKLLTVRPTLRAACSSSRILAGCLPNNPPRISASCVPSAHAPRRAQT